MIGRAVAAAALAALAAGSPPQVAFKELASPRYGIVRMDEDGGAPLELTKGQPEPSVFGAFSWAPDGSRLVYAARDGVLYTVAADGGAATALTHGGRDTYPAWSPDGTRIAYVHTADATQRSEIWVVGADGSGARALTDDGGDKLAPAWSPDGSRILYERVAGGFETFVVDASTGRVVLRTSDAGGVWSPDGSRIAVSTGRGIDVIAADGSGRRTVALDAGAPVWSPDGTRIAFGPRTARPGSRASAARSSAPSTSSAPTAAASAA